MQHTLSILLAVVLPTLATSDARAQDVNLARGQLGNVLSSLDRDGWSAARLTARSLDAPVPLLAAPMTISDKFRRLKAPGTRRAAVQLTSGAATCYLLYYFAPSCSLRHDGRHGFRTRNSITTGR